MIRLSANVSKKVPLPDVEFSSQQFSAGMEVELSSSVDKDELKGKIRALYGLLEESIDEQIGAEIGSGASEPARVMEPKRSRKSFPMPNLHFSTTCPTCLPARPRRQRS